MCVIYHKPAGVKVDIDVIATMWESNPHGGGIMWNDGEDVLVVRGIMTLDEMKESTEVIADSMEAVFHFRVSTGGGITRDNTQPFVLSGGWTEATFTPCDMAFCHNGIVGDPIGGKSDTRLLAESMVDMTAAAVMKRLDMLAEATWSSFALMTRDGVERFGDWCEFDGGFASNMYWDLNRPHIQFW
jgi:predicted glutamine amidotransferase